MIKKCLIYSTSRALRRAVVESDELLLPTMLTMGEFLSRVELKNDRFTPDSDLRLLALYESCEFDNFIKLDIDREFFSFIENSTYIFSFLEELAQERVDIDELLGIDIYGEYEEHINILKNIKSRYKKIVDKNRWNDRIFSSENIEINRDFLSNFSSITINVDGYLSRYELEILKECSSAIETNIVVEIGRFNQKLSNRLEDFSLESGYRYELNLSSKEIVSKEKTSQNSTIAYEEFETRLAQIGFIKSKIEQFALSGVSPSDIVVVLPDESFAKTLELFDREGNFNFAMGLSYTNTSLFKTLQTLELFMQNSDIINAHRIKKIDEKLFEWFRQRYHRNFDFDDFMHLKEFFIDEDAQVLEMFDAELRGLSFLSHIFSKYEFKEVYKIFLNRLKSLKIDDSRGGKITVMGLLESRGISYDGVIVVDFNESYAPKHLQKDLFLNSTLKEQSGLPSTQDRESLQKHYYDRLFSSAKMVAISAVKNATSTPSRFIKELGISKSSERYDYSSALFSKNIELKYSHREFEGEYDFTKSKLSASKLKTLLRCKRAFYYKYVMKIAEHKIPLELSSESEIGNIIHEALKKLYSSKKSFDDVDELRGSFSEHFKIQMQDDSVARFSKRYWLDIMEHFFASDIGRFKDGYSVLECEKPIECEHNGIMLYGVIDRIDIKDASLELLDYKSGSFSDVSKPPRDDEIDFQLDIYEILASSLAEVKSSGYYELSSGKIYHNIFSDERRKLLESHLDTLRDTKYWLWSMSDDIKACRFCPYVFMCGREAYRNV